jgi:DNA-binding transcriptional MocR family regulator
MKSLPERKPPLYMKVAGHIERQIRNGALQVGDRAPSIRALKRQQGVSVSTVLQAYFLLENRGWIEPRPQSGFYVRVPYSEMVPEPGFNESRSSPTEVGVGSFINEVAGNIDNPERVPLGAATASPALYPSRKLNQMIQRITREAPTHSANYCPPNGVEELRHQIARRSPSFGCSFAPRDLIVTCGAMEALHLALRATTKPDDVIAIESPTYFGVLQTIESLGMKALEIPTHPREGMDLDVLESSIRKHRVRACVTMTNCQNPLGFVLPNDYKKELVALTARNNVAVIEDDVYGELTFEGPRPKTAKAYDRDGLVLLCTSFSKVLAPGFRVGWMHPGRFQAEVEKLKFITTLASPSLPQLTVAGFIESGGYDRYLRKLRAAFADQVRRFGQAISRYFPQGTKISRPLGGYVLWVELPERVDAAKLYRSALAHNISILPGVMFSPSGRYRNHLRISCGHAWSETIDQALITLGKLCEKASR